MLQKNFILASLTLVLLLTQLVAIAQGTIQNDTQQKKMTIKAGVISFTVDYNKKANISQVILNGETIVNGNEGIFSRIKTKTGNYTSLNTTGDPKVTVTGTTAEISNIVYGDRGHVITETWKFTVAKDIKFEIIRSSTKSVEAEQVALPVITFNNINTWEGAYTDYGGLAWFYLFNKRLDSYGVHTNASKFWNSKTGNGFSVVVDAPGDQVAMRYTRTGNDKLTCSVTLSAGAITPRFDAPTFRRRFVRDTTDVWAGFTMPSGTSHETITFSYFSFDNQFGRGDLKGVNGNEVSAVLNTIARIGVIDKKHFGGNSWATPYGPICLHEQYIAQMGLAINDPNYLKGYQECLDYYRDNAITPEGRVWPRWAYTNEDMMPGKVTDKGFYEAQWGYLLDSNPDIVTNVVELYDQTGDIAWVKTHQQSCRKALDWILERDSDADGLVEMMTDSHMQKRGSDWIDIIWAAYENAFVNAKLYHALVLWADIEHQLGDEMKAAYYNKAAVKLKNSFNKPVSDGGFWDGTAGCYVHWLDKDKSVHGTNMVTPVNFMAIGYGICDDQNRTKQILDQIETQMQKENLFFWPLCMTTYQPGEGNDWQFPFANYENGDIFLSWGAMGVKAYASYKPELALKYVNNVLGQYAKDGLAFQRYGRAKQDGLGDDILSGNSLSVVGLYNSIYGINPKYNRLYLDPHITEVLAGTSLRYNFRNQKLKIDLAMNNYSVSNGQFRIVAKTDFGYYATDKSITFFNRNSETPSLFVETEHPLTLDVAKWSDDKIAFTQSTTVAGKLNYEISGRKPNKEYNFYFNGVATGTTKSNSAGILRFQYAAKANITQEIRIEE